MDQIISLGIPVATWILMLVVGLSLRTTEIRDALVGRKKALIGGILGQMLCIPLAAFAVIFIFSIDGRLAAGILLVAACPAGGISNYYTYLARANSALSVGLTGVSLLTSLATMPLLLTAYKYLGFDLAGLEVPVLLMVAQLLVFIVVPVGLGSILRTTRPAFADRYTPIMRTLSWTLMACLIGLIVFENWTGVVQEFDRIAIAAGSMIGLAVFSGLATAKVLRLEAEDVLTLAIEFPARNLAVATVTAVTILGQSSFAVFAATYFVIELLIVAALVFLFRGLQRFSRKAQ